MPKLNDTQLVIPSTAAQRPSNAIFPLPGSLGLNKGTAAALLKRLLTCGVAAERPANRSDEVWREEDDRRLTLAVSDAGLEAIGIEPESALAATNAGPAVLEPHGSGIREASEPHLTTGQKVSTAPRSSTKLAFLATMLRRDDGATIAEIAVATTWQAHSIRGAISGHLKKKLGLSIVSTVETERGRVYRIVGMD